MPAFGMTPREEPLRVSDHVILNCHVTGDTLSLRGARMRWAWFPRDSADTRGSSVLRFARPLTPTLLPWRRSEAMTCAGTSGWAMGWPVREEDVGAQFRCEVALTNGTTLSSRLARLVLLTHLSAVGIVHD